MVLNNFSLKTERLKIRNIKIEDVDLLLKMDKQEVTQLYLGGIKNKTKDERIIFLENKINKYKNEQLIPLTICLLDGKAIGFIEFKISKINAEISYIFDVEYCNKGYCTEACKTLIHYIFNKLKIKRIFAKTIIDNNSSKRVLEKLGFKQINNNIEDLKFIEYELKNN